MELNHENYHSLEANREYMSASQFKAFRRCEAKALAEVKGLYTPPKTTALLIGSYIDCHFSGLPWEGPDIHKKDGTLKAEYSQAEDIIRRVESDDFCKALIDSSQKQVIKTGSIGGVAYKVMFDFLLPSGIVDLKIMRDLDSCFDSIQGIYLPWWRYYGYDYQGAIYQAIEGNNQPFGLLVATKQPEPDLAALRIADQTLRSCLVEVEAMSERYWAIKQGLIAPEHCGKCDYCRGIKKLEGWQEVC